MSESTYAIPKREKKSIETELGGSLQVTRSDTREPVLDPRKLRGISPEVLADDYEVQYKGSRIYFNRHGEDQLRASTDERLAIVLSRREKMTAYDVLSEIVRSEHILLLS